MKALFLSIIILILLGAGGPISIAQQRNNFQVPEQLGQGYDFEGNGKDLDAHKQFTLYELTPNDLLNQAFDMNAAEAAKALQIQKEYLKSKNRIHNYEGLSFDDESLYRTVNLLLKVIDKEETSSSLNLFKLAGEDWRGNVHFTAYYTPTVEARRQRDSIFKYPIYSLPESWSEPKPTREMIDDYGSLSGRGLELAWTTSLLENYFLQVQGSGFLQFKDGSGSNVIFSGQNGYPYASIGKYMVKQGYIDASDISMEAIRKWFYDNPDSLQQILNLNKSYVFFKLTKETIRGAAHTELVPGHSIAVDPKYIPYGTVLLAKIPILNNMGELEKHEYRFLTAQDRGGAIKGPGHVDLYEGMGKGAEQRAGSLHHYGALWLILLDKDE